MTQSTRSSPFTTIPQTVLNKRIFVRAKCELVFLLRQQRVACPGSSNWRSYSAGRMQSGHIWHSDLIISCAKSAAIDRAVAPWESGARRRRLTAAAAFRRAPTPRRRTRQSYREQDLDPSPGREGRRVGGRRQSGVGRPLYHVGSSFRAITERRFGRYRVMRQ